MPSQFRFAPLVLLTLFFSANLFAAVPFAERNALLAFYGGTIGGNWTNNSGWLNGDPCDDAWFGVGCNFDNTTVTSLFLTNNNLAGNITTFIEDLPNLTFVNLSGNAIEGGIPAQFGTLMQMTTLNLSTNQLASAIPPGVATLPLLQDLDLNNNNLAGPLPPTWSGSLQFVRLNSNIIHGSLPAGIGAMTNLTLLYMNNNRLEGPIPPEIGMLANLTQLTLHRNRLDGPLPTEIGDLTLLEFLRLDSNKINGQVPSSVMNLVNLNPAGTSVRYNALFTMDGALDGFLDTASGEDWSATQTIAPVNLHKTGATDNCISMEWDVVEYTADPGNYNVTYSATPGGPYDPSFVITADKFDNQHTQCSLDPGETYYFIVRTVTVPHALNENVVTSDWSPEVAMSTTGLPPGTFVRDGFETVTR